MPRIVTPDEGKLIRLYAVRFRLLVESQGVGGTLAILATEVPSGTSRSPIGTCGRTSSAIGASADRKVA